jgi:hypothetical protein
VEAHVDEGDFDGEGALDEARADWKKGSVRRIDDSDDGSTVERLDERDEESRRKSGAEQGGARPRGGGSSGKPQVTSARWRLRQWFTRGQRSGVPTKHR